MINKAGSQKKGFVLVFVIVAIILATILTGALYQSVFLSNRLFMQQQNNKLAYYIAVSGVEYAFYIIKCGHYTITNYLTWPTCINNDPTFDPTNGTVPGASVYVRITSNGATPPVYTITSVGQYPGATKTIVVICTSAKNVTSWTSS